jgi:hypothetical protein
VVWVTAAVDIVVAAPAMGDHFLGEKVVPRMMGVSGIVGLLNGEPGHDEIGVLICDCRMRMEIGSGLSSSDLDSCLWGSVPPVCSSLEQCLILVPILYRCALGNSRPTIDKLSVLEYPSRAQCLL